MSKIESGKLDMRYEPFDLRLFLESLVSVYQIQAGAESKEAPERSFAYERFFYRRAMENGGRILYNKVDLSDPRPFRRRML